MNEATLYKYNVLQLWRGKEISPKLRDKIWNGKPGFEATCMCAKCEIIGASLSEPHTSVTALCTCMCMSVCLSVCGHIPKILNERI